MALFDGVLYWASFAPAALSQVCNAGEARLWGRDYLNNDPTCASAFGGRCGFRA